MKGKVSYILFFLFGFLISGCSSDDGGPLPKAGFTLSETTPMQWDEVSIDSKASDGSISYKVSGGDYHISDDQSGIVFFDDQVYEVTQIVSNNNGKDELTIPVTVSHPDNHYFLDNEKLILTDSPLWNSKQKQHLIRFLADVPGQNDPNKIDLYPVAGNNNLDASYLYDGRGELIGTYISRVTSGFTGSENTSEWTTDYKGSDGGSELNIQLIYTDPDDSANNAYEITLTQYDLSIGRYDFLAGKFIKTGERSFSIFYRGRLLK